VIPLQAAAMALVAFFALSVVLTREIVRLAMISSAYALTLVVLFVIFQAPDVALSELVVGAVAFPLVIVVAIVMQRGGE
jgi:energy-converting hydrogenase B subunit D